MERPQLNDEEWEVLKNLLGDHAIWSMIGGEEWSLSERDEELLWKIIEKVTGK